MEKYIAIEAREKDITHIAVSVSYDKGGKNVFTGADVPRGYYLTVYPVKRERGLVSFEAWAGVRLLVVSCGRKSDKKEAEAMTEAAELAVPLVRRVCSKNGIASPDPAAVVALFEGVAG